MRRIAACARICGKTLAKQKRMWYIKEKYAGGQHMKALLLSCSTGEGHNHCAMAVKEALVARGHQAEFLDMLCLCDDLGPLSIESVLNTISSKTPEVFGMIYKAGAMYSATGITSPVYLANIRYANELCDVVERRGYDAIICSHLFPMETLTYLRRRRGLTTRCYGVLSDYTCIPFFPETELDGYFLPHEDVRGECIRAGMDKERLLVTGMPVSPAFFHRREKGEARALLGLPVDQKIYLVMTGGIGCGDALALCAAIRAMPDDGSLIVVLTGRNQELQADLTEKYGETGDVRAVPFTDQVAEYMASADVLLSKAGGISSSESAALGVPLVHTMAIPGVETLNAAFFAAHGMSFYARNEDQAARFADRLLYDGVSAAAMRLAQEAGVPRDGAARIVECIEAELSR